MNDPKPSCPLVTSHTGELGIPEHNLQMMERVRNWVIPDDGALPFTWPSRLRRHLFNPLRKTQTSDPLEPKQFQLQMVHNLVRMPRFIDGDAVGLGKTWEAVIAASWLREKLDKLKVIVLTTKSTTGQWAEEFERLSLMRPKILADKHKKLHSYQARYSQLQEFLKNDDHDVLVAKYTSLLGTRRKVEGKFDEDGFPVARDGRERVSREVKQFLRILKPYGDDVLLILDECQKFKSIDSQTRYMVQILSRPCGRVWAMTATVIKNTLEEFYSVAAAIGIRPFGSVQEFQDRFCIYAQVHVGGGRHKAVLKGYRDVAEFKEGMRPFFLGRSQRQVKEKLPRLATQMYPIDLDEEQARLLLEDIPSGKFQLPPTFKKVNGEWMEFERDPDNKFTMLSLYQLVANHPALIDPDNIEKFHTTKLSPKEEHLLDMIDGDLRGEKLIVFTKSRTWIDRLQWLTENGYFTERKFLRITGAESEKTRNAAKQLFQDPESGYDLIFINTAGIEGINLQQAAHMIALDAPWSWGDLLQLVGRMLRLASPHSLCTLHVFVGKGTVDEYAIETLRGKKGVFETILGESHSAGLLDDRDVFDMESGMEQVAKDSEFIDMMRAHVKDVSLGTFLKGQLLAEAQASPDYETIYEVRKKRGRTKKAASDQKDLDFLAEISDDINMAPY